MLSDTGFGEGGTTFLRGGPRVVAAALGERGEMTHAELLKCAVVESRRDNLHESRRNSCLLCMHVNRSFVAHSFLLRYQVTDSLVLQSYSFVSFLRTRISLLSS